MREKIHFIKGFYKIIFKHQVFALKTVFDTASPHYGSYEEKIEIRFWLGLRKKLVEN